MKPAYKKTDLGIIPEEWEPKVMGEACWFQEGPGVRNTQFTRFGVKLLNGTNIFRGELNLSTTVRFISESEAYGAYAHFLADKDDIVIASSGITVARLHEKVAHVRESDLPFCMNTSTIRFKPISGVLDRSFLFHILTSDGFKKQIGAQATGSAQLNFGPSHVSKVKVVLPPLREQAAIAQALNDVDALIMALDSLIAKKRDIKQATMQQLLTGKTRLPGFSGKWEVKQLGDVVQIKKGQLITSSTLKQGDIPVIAGGKQPAYYHASANRFGRTITISASGASAGYVALYNYPIFASDCSTISESGSYSLDFIYYQLLSMQQTIYKSQTGGAQPHIHAKDLTPLKALVPSMPEQVAIAAVLSDMDAELSALEARRDKTRDLKQGMMQELLTGKTRLI
jgi:type I restriction enzyme S subunit